MFAVNLHLERLRRRSGWCEVHDADAVMAARCRPLPSQRLEQPAVGSGQRNRVQDVVVQTRRMSIEFEAKAPLLRIGTERERRDRNGDLPHGAGGGRWFRAAGWTGEQEDRKE